MNMQTRLKPEAAKKMEEKWKLEHRAIELLELVALEFETDFTSVQSFDLRTVNEIKSVVKKLRKLAIF